MPLTLQLPDARLRVQVAKILGIGPFDESILDMTELQMLWLLKHHNTKDAPTDATTSFEDPDFDEIAKEVLNGR